MTQEQADILNSAREVLDALGEDCKTRRGDDAFREGAVFAACECASDAIFQALNFASAYGGDPIAQANVHGKRGAA